MSEEPTVAPEEEVTTVEEAPKSEDKQLSDILKEQATAPTQEQIDAWKLEHGEVYVSGFSETELYVWRPLTRPEYVAIQIESQKPDTEMNQFKLEEFVCNTCVVYKSVQSNWADGKAGTPQTLSEQIMQHSNFLTPAAASMLVAKL